MRVPQDLQVRLGSDNGMAMTLTIAMESFPFELEKYTTYQQYETFQACHNYLTWSLSKHELSCTYMLTHDVDEFLWFDQNSTGTISLLSSSPFSLKQVVSQLISIHAVESLLIIPRLLFGSSGHNHYEPDLVMNHFTHCFDVDSCRPKGKQQNDLPRLSQRKQPNHSRRCLFSQERPQESFCDSKQDNFHSSKSMSLVLALASKCHYVDNVPVHCHMECWTNFDLQEGVNNTVMPSVQLRNKGVVFIRERALDEGSGIGESSLRVGEPRDSQKLCEK